MISDFSGGYYHASMNAQEYDDGPIIDRRLYRYIQNELYGDESPVLMRLGMSDSMMFEVDSEGAVPRDVLALPEEFMDEPGDVEVFILKPEYQDVVGDYYG